MNQNSLAKTFTASKVKRLARERPYARGVTYERDGRVESVMVTDDRVRATARGTVPYEVQLWVDGIKPGWSCTCPAAEDGSFCKHCVAVALSLAPKASPKPATKPATNTMPSGLYYSGRPQTIAVWQKRIRKAFAPYGDFVSYREVERWANRVHNMVTDLDELCDAGHHDAAALLVEYAHRRADEAVQYIDDSAGWLSVISSRLAEVHLRACTAGRPDGVELATRLLELELTSELDAFHRSAAVYGELLGEDGLAAFHKSLEPRWKKLKPNSDGWESGTFAVRQAMVGWAIGTGDPDALIKVHSRDRMFASDVLEIAQSLLHAGRDSEAVEWAGRGLEDHDNLEHLMPPLREFLAELLRSRGESEAAIELYWQALVKHPSLHAYRRLVTEADSDDDIPQRCVEMLLDRIGDPQGEEEDLWHGSVSPVTSALIQILLYEGRIDEAWDVATRRGCGQKMWLTLARYREPTHPLDAIAVYEAEVFARIDQKKNAAYGAAVELMERIDALADSAGAPDHFVEFRARVRDQHAQKPNLMKLFAEREW